MTVGRRGIRIGFVDASALAGRLALVCPAIELFRHYGHAPNSVGKVVCYDKRAPGVYCYANRPTAGLAILSHKALYEVDRRTCRPAVAKRHEHYLVPSRRLPVPTPVFADEYAIGKLGAHARRGERNSKPRHV